MTVIPGGVILFDGSGKLTVRQYGLRLAPPGGANPITDLGRYVYTGNQDMATITQRDWPSPFAQASQQFLLSQIGLVILDHETFAAQGFGDDNGNDAQREHTGRRSHLARLQHNPHLRQPLRRLPHASGVRNEFAIPNPRFAMALPRCPALTRFQISNLKSEIPNAPHNSQLTTHNSPVVH